MGAAAAVVAPESRWVVDGMHHALRPCVIAPASHSTSGRSGDGPPENRHVARLVLALSASVACGTTPSAGPLVSEEPVGSSGQSESSEGADGAEPATDSGSSGSTDPDGPNVGADLTDEGASTGDAFTGDASTGDASTGDASTGDASTGDASTGDASTGDASTGDASTGDASTDDGLATGDEPASDSGDPGASFLFDDEFDCTANLLSSSSSWQLLFTEQAASMAEGSEPGFLSMTAEPTSENSWYFEYHGAALYKEVTGNFAVMTSVRTTSIDNPDAGPEGSFNSGGLLIRDVSSDNGSENWMTFNIGQQASSYRREVKKTVSGGSNYFLNPQAQTSEHLLACRVGASFFFYAWDEDLEIWVAERFYNQVPTPTGLMNTELNDLYDGSRNPELVDPEVGESTELAFEFATMSDTVQLGLMMNSWGEPHDVLTEFDYVRLAGLPPQNEDDCTTELVPD